MAITGWRFRPLSALSLDAGTPRSRRTAWGVRCCAMVSVGLPLLAFRQVRDRELSPASWRGFFCGRALCNQLCGSALGWRVCRMPGARSVRPLVQVQVGKPGSVRHHDPTSPASPCAGLFLKSRNQLCGSVLSWRVCCLTRQAHYDGSTKLSPASAGLFLSGRWQPIASRPRCCGGLLITFAEKSQPLRRTRAGQAPTLPSLRPACEPALALRSAGAAVGSPDLAQAGIRFA